MRQRFKILQKSSRKIFKTKDKDFNDNALVVFEIFKVIENYEQHK